MGQIEQDWRPRLSVDLTPEQAMALRRWIPWGMKKMVFSALVDLLIKALELGGPAVLASVIRHELNLPGLLSKEKP